jgi:hypothetical protein
MVSLSHHRDLLADEIQAILSPITNIFTVIIPLCGVKLQKYNVGTVQGNDLGNVSGQYLDSARRYFHVLVYIILIIHNNYM